MTPDSQTISLEIPPKYVGKQIEVIAFAKDEGINDEQSTVKTVSFEALSLDTKSYKFNRDEANER
ncbi:MAG: hypothetical protein EOP42_30595 [Sphingobacteriaceae bacterium]|nr:MAG: hypothetical protein EOP42_30595 [Sphingobacteriaceae bacterium]